MLSRLSDGPNQAWMRRLSFGHRQESSHSGLTLGLAPAAKPTQSAVIPFEFNQRYGARSGCIHRIFINRAPLYYSSDLALKSLRYRMLRQTAVTDYPDIVENLFQRVFRFGTGHG